MSIRKQVHALAKEGKTFREICALFPGVSYNTIRSYFYTAESPRRKRGEIRDEIYSYFRRGKTVLDVISERPDINAGTIRTYARQWRLLGNYLATPSTTRQDCSIGTNIPYLIADKLQKEADRRGISRKKLLSQLINTIAEDNMFKAILDD